MNNFYIERSMGEFVYSWPTIKALGGGVLYSGLPMAAHNAIKPLALAQPYIEDFIHESEHGLPKGFINLVGYHYLNANGKHLAYTFSELMGVKIDLQQPWITLPKLPEITNERSYAVMNITPRYRDKVFSYYKELEFLHENTNSPIRFLGHMEEYKLFTKRYGRKDIVYCKTNDLLEAACLIKDAKYYTGTQSCLLAVAEGLGIPYRFERSPYADNTKTGRPNETIINTQWTRKLHFLLTRSQEIIRNLKS